MGCTSSSAVNGGFTVGDQVFYAGPEKPSGKTDRVVKFGMQGEIVGQTCGGNAVVAFNGGAFSANLRPIELLRKAPCIPGGFSIGDDVFYGGPSRKYPNGDQLSFSSKGSVAGCSCVGDGMDEERVAVSFPGHTGAKAVRLALLFRTLPVVPGGYKVGDRVYWCGMKWTFPNGDKLQFGAQGEVAGRSCVGDGMDDERVAVNFPGNKGPVAMRLPEISHEPPVIPGGYRVGDRVFYAYPNWKAPDGHVLQFGVQGKVIGRSCIGDGKDDERVWALFPGLGYGCICLEQISRDRPVIPGGYKLGEKVYYAGPSRLVGINGDKLTFGSHGEVAGKATTSRPGHEVDVAVTFPGNEDTVDVRLVELSRTLPVLPGSYQLHDKVFYIGPDKSFPNGDRLMFGARGEVAGCSCGLETLDHDKVAVLLPGNRVASDLNLIDLSRLVPPALEARLSERLKQAMEQDEAGKDNIAEFAAVHQLADGAGFNLIAMPALHASFALVEKSKRKADLVLLSNIRRAAEEAEWHDLWQKAMLAIEEVALPRVLASAEADFDIFALLAVERRSTERGFTDLAQRAKAAVERMEVNDEVIADLTADRRQLRLEEEGEIVEQMQKLVDDTYTGWGGYGRRTRTRDRPNETVAERLEVSKVVQLRNMDSYLNYCIRKQVISAELPRDVRRDWNIRTNSGLLSPTRAPSGERSAEASPREAGRRVGRLRTGSDGGSPRSARSVRSLSLESEFDPFALSGLGSVDANINEHYLWHGTGPAEATGIANIGFDMGQAGSSRGALFGRGLYFAESSLKADEYVRADEKACFPLILCRVTLGHVNYCDAEDPWEIREALRVSCKRGGRYHSVLGDREKVRQTFREFVVFDGHQAYPEYIVWYTRK